MKILESDSIKVVHSPDYNYVFDKKTGQFARWGITKEDDPEYSPYGPELLDLEISSGGECLGRCQFCYKGNGKLGDPTKNLTLDQFKQIFDKMPKTLTQIAFGIMNVSTNPDFFAMMDYARSNGVIPNYTCHGLDVTPEIAKKTAETCGAVAVSILVNKDKAYDAIKMFTDAGMTQVNAHVMTSRESLPAAMNFVKDMKSDPRLARMNAVVFLQYKNKGTGKDKFHSVSDEETYRKLVEYCIEMKINYGFDSCSAPLFMRTTRDEKAIQFAEPCESGLFSSYINCEGHFYPCSFCEGESNWNDEGIDVLHCEDFMKDVWFHPRVNEWRGKLLASSKGCSCKFANICRSCPIYNVTGCKNEEY